MRNKLSIFYMNNSLPWCPKIGIGIDEILCVWVNNFVHVAESSGHFKEKAPPGLSH